MDIDEDGEKPGADRAFGPEETTLREGPFEAILHEVIGAIEIACQRPGV